MRLAFITPEFLPTWGGIGTYTVELIRNLSCYDLEIHVITPRRGKDYNAQSIEDYFNNKIKIHNISNAEDYFFYNLKFQLALVKNFYFLQRKYSFDLIHISNLVNMPDIFLKILGLRVPSVTTVHTTLRSQSHIQGSTKLRTKSKESIEKWTMLLYPALQFFEKIYLKKSHHIITVSEWVKSFIPRQYSGTISIIHNGIDTDKFSPEHRNDDEFRFISSIDKPIVLYSGRLLALKGFDILLKSVKPILQTCSAYFIFAGTGDIDKWKALVSDIPDDSYTFLGYVDYEKINCLYAKADLFVLPSLTESFPLVLLEAMASGLPVIATRVGGIPEMIEHRKDGILVEPNCTEELIEAIVFLLQNPRSRKEFSMRARQKVERLFTGRQMAEKTMTVYREVLKG